MTQEMWYNIDWKLCEQQLAEKQNYLAIAAKQGKLSEIKGRQNQIMRMFAARALAVRKVTTNRGKTTAGVDGEKWATAAKKMQAVTRLKDLSQYHPQPVRRVWIPKPGKAERRPLGILTMFDRAVQALVLLAFEPIVESLADSRSFGFRRHRSVRDAAEYIRLLCASNFSKRYILEVDIKKFFDTINHQWLLNNMPINKEILRKMLKAGVLDLQKFDATEMSVPQGGVLSPSLANATLDGLEKAVNTTGAFLVRYADDFIVAADKASALTLAQHEIEKFLEIRGLSINCDKTRGTIIDKGFDFLGYYFREYPDAGRVKYNKLGIFLIKPTQQNVVNICRKVSEVVRKHPNANSGRIIIKLNPILRGWAEHYRTVSSRAAFRRVSQHVFLILKKWVYRKHKTVGRRVALRKYFKTVKTRNSTQHWVFTGVNERKEPITLLQIGGTNFCKHKLIAVKQPQNPFLLEHRAYFEKRALDNIRNSALVDKKKKGILMKQNGFCGHCGKLVEAQDVIEIHHILGIKQGGSDKLANLMAVHKECHRQITISQKARKRSGQ